MFNDTHVGAGFGHYDQGGSSALAIRRLTSPAFTWIPAEGGICNGFDPADRPTEPLACYQTYRQLSGCSTNLSGHTALIRVDCSKMREGRNPQRYEYSLPAQFRRCRIGASTNLSQSFREAK